MCLIMHLIIIIRLRQYQNFLVDHEQ
jgi:hypothetical protein